MLCVPEAIVFRPTVQEFADPLVYIEKIRQQAERIGICRIIPPAGWKPPFQLDQKLRIQTQVQHLRTIEGICYSGRTLASYVVAIAASSRLREEFLESLLNFMRAQGVAPKTIPKINGDVVDVYELYKLVCERGGFRNLEEHNPKEKTWENVAEALGLISLCDPQGNGTQATVPNKEDRQGIAQQLRQCYIDVLTSYEDDQSEGQKMFSGDTMLPTAQDIANTSTQSSALRGRICDYRITKKEGTLGLALGDRYFALLIVPPISDFVLR